MPVIPFPCTTGRKRARQPTAWAAGLARHLEGWASQESSGTRSRDRPSCRVGAARSAAEPDLRLSLDARVCEDPAARGDAALSLRRLRRASLSQHRVRARRIFRSCAWTILRDARAAFNTRDSMSGMLALKLVFAPLAGRRRFFAGAIETGSHVGSMRAVARRRGRRLRRRLRNRLLCPALSKLAAGRARGDRPFARRSGASLRHLRSHQRTRRRPVASGNPRRHRR